MENITCPPLETLYFLHYDKTNTTEINELENKWPCELRIYFNNPSLQGLASFVQFLFNYGTITLVVTGLLVNTYSLFVLNSPPINKTNMSVYLKALAVSDMASLVFDIGIGLSRAKSSSISNIFINHRWMCTLHIILISVFFNYSSWLVVTFSFERLLMIRNPLKIHTWHNEKPAKVTVIIIAVVALVLALLRSMMTGYEKDNFFGYIPCGANNHVKISTNLVTIVLINVIAPIALIITANVCLSIHIRRSTQVSSNMRANSDQKDYLKVTRMMIVISIVYVLLYLPYGVVSCIDLYFRKIEPSPEDYELHIEWAKNMMLLHWTRGFCYFFYLVNFVNNFFLYCLSGDIFRQALKTRCPSNKQKVCSSLALTKAISSRTSKWIGHTPPTFQELGGSSSSSTEIQTSNTLTQTGYSNEAFSITNEKSCADDT